MKKTINLNEYNLPIVIEKDKSGGFVAICKVWSDCYAQGDTIEEVTQEIVAVATSLVELYREEGLKIPLTHKKTVKKPEQSFDINVSFVVSN